MSWAALREPIGGFDMCEGCRDTALCHTKDQLGGTIVHPVSFPGLGVPWSRYLSTARWMEDMQDRQE